MFQIGVPEASSAPPEIMDVTKSSANLAWSKPKDDGGSQIIGYFIEYKDVSSEKWVRHETRVNSTMYTLSGLTTDAEYQFRVIAVNDIGESEPGPASDSVICKDPFGKEMSYLINILSTFKLNRTYCTTVTFFLLQTNQVNQER